MGAKIAIVYHSSYGNKSAQAEAGLLKPILLPDARGCAHRFEEPGAATKPARDLRHGQPHAPVAALPTAVPHRLRERSRR